MAVLQTVLCNLTWTVLLCLLLKPIGFPFYLNTTHSLLHGQDNCFSYMLWIPIFAEIMPTKPWNQIMNIVAADEKLYTDFRDHNKTEPCSVKFKTACIQQWVQIIEQDYNISATCLADGTQVLKSTDNLRVTIKCHTTTGVILVQGSDFIKWRDYEFSRLRKLMSDNMGVRTLLKSKGWSLVETPRDGLCLLHATCIAFNNANPHALINLNYLGDGLHKETEKHFSLFRGVCIEDPYIELRRYVQYKVWDQPLVDLVPYSLSNYLNVIVHIVTEESRGECVLHSIYPGMLQGLDPPAKGQLDSIAVHLQGQHYSALVPTNSSAVDITSLVPVAATPKARPQRRHKSSTTAPWASPQKKASSPAYPGFVQLGDCSFHTLDEVHQDLGSPLSTVLKKRSISFSLNDSTSDATPLLGALSEQAAPTDIPPSPASTPTQRSFSSMGDDALEPPSPTPSTDVPTHDALSSCQAALGHPSPPEVLPINDALSCRRAAPQHPSSPAAVAQPHDVPTLDALSFKRVTPGHPFPSPANMPTENLPSELPTHDACSVQRVTPGYPSPSLADMPTFNPHAERHDPPQSETGPNNPPPAQAQSGDPQPSQSGTHESPPCQTELQSPSLADMPTPNPHAERHDPPQPETGLNPLPAQAQFGDHPPSQAGAHESPPSQAELHTHPSTPPVNNIMGSTLLIGSSQLKLVKPRFLHKTLVQTMRGATVLDAYSRLSNTTLGPYSQIILQFGSNDLDRRPEMVVLEYKLLLSAVRLNTKSTSKIFISAIPPRLDRRAEAAKCLNGYLSSLADPVANIFFLSHDSAFATAAVPHGLASCLARDKYHLNKKGTGILLSSLNETLGFVKPHRSSHMPAHQRHHRQGSQLNQRRCYNCGETNHLRDRCWYGRKLQCRICHIYGHKASACFERHQSNNREIPALDSLEDFPSLPVRDGVEQATSPPPNFVENRFPNHFPHAAGKTFRSHPDQCPAIPRTARSVQERPWASQTVPTTIPVVRLTTPAHPMIDELSIGANPYQSGTMHAPQWSHTTPMYPMIHELPVHANPYQFGTQHALQWSHPHHDRNYVSQYHVAEIDQHTWPHLSY